jgi:photosystem II stability/assembly factor-like uncharacterized protein
MHRSWLISVALSAALGPTWAQTPTALDEQIIAGFRARSIGPAAMSGRISAIDAYVDQGRVHVYVGAASGGVWKSTNGGTTFKPIFDQHNQSIGAIRIDPRNRQTIWVGTGESWVRNSTSVGDGLYKSIDGGDNWSFVALKNSERIAAIEVDPSDSNTVYVAAMGQLWGPNDERGLYKTSDGGKTWKRILFVDENTGCTAVAIDRSNPQTVFAAMWQYRRKAWTFESGGSGSGLYKSEDGGASWTELTEDPKTGLPRGEIGRIAIAIAPSDSKIIYATVEAKDGALFRSGDGGATWERRNANADVLIRPFYFSALVVDPQRPDRIYKPGYNLITSDDGGTSFTSIGGSAHADHHALWIRPDNPDLLYTGTDGGLFISENRGVHWRFVENLPLSQFYRVAVDMATPYNVYGGLQDNACWYGPSRAGGSIQNRHWRILCGGDGFWTFEDPADSRFIYTEIQGGEAMRVDRRTLETRKITPQEPAGATKYRWNWNTPLVPSPNHKGRIYIGAQYLFRSDDHGNSWQQISPDLTTNDASKQQQELSGGVTIDNSSAETHTTIYAIAESPKNGDLIWVGTDDGQLQLTRDGGRSWNNLSARVSGVPAGSWVSWVEPSPHQPGTVWVAFDNHTRGDMRTYVAKSTDFGQTWSPVESPQLSGFAHVIRQDLVNPELLFLGTESGLFVSLDGGRAWARFTGGQFPPVPVRAIEIHPRDHELIIGTHGRGIWIVDDLLPLRALTTEVLAQSFAWLPTKPAVLRSRGSDSWMTGDAGFDGQDASDGVQLAYYQKKRHLVGEFRVEILDSSGRLLWSEAGNPRRGATTLFWSMFTPGVKPPAGGGDITGMFLTAVGPRVTEGIYRVRAVRGRETHETSVTIVPDPDSSFTAADRRLRFDTATRIGQIVERMRVMVDQIIEVRDRAKSRREQVRDKRLAAQLDRLVQDLEVHRNRFVPIKETGGITGERRLREFVGELYLAVNQYPGPPSRAQLDRAAALESDFEAASAEARRAIATSRKSINPKLRSAKLDPL